MVTGFSRHRHIPGARNTWELLSEIYHHDTYLSDFSEDPRKPRAAEMVLAAWKAYEVDCAKDVRHPQPQRPAFLTTLENLLAQRPSSQMETANGDQQRPESGTVEYANHTIHDSGVARSQEGSALIEDDQMDANFDLVLSDIDWSFWSNW